MRTNNWLCFKERVATTSPVARRKATITAAILLFLAPISVPVGAQEPGRNLIAEANSQAFGIPYEEAVRRLGLLEEANEIAKRIQADIGQRYGGLRVTDNRDFKVEFLITGNPEGVLAKYTNRPEFAATQVSRSYEALRNKAERLRKALEGEEEIYAIAVVPAKNKVEVRHRPSAKGREGLRRTKLIDESVDVIEDEEVFVRTATCYGGTGLTGPNNYATSGFIVTDNLQTRRGMVTAAHLEECASTRDCSGNIVPAPSGCVKNRPVRDDYNGVTWNFVRQVYQTDYDMEFRVPSTTQTLTNQIRYGASSEVAMSVTATYNPRNYAEGTFSMCKQGRTTKYTCGRVDVNYAAFSGGMTGTFIRAVNNTPGAAMAAPGDSGGPVFTQNGAVGITVGAGGTKLGTCPNNTYTYLYFEPVDSLSALDVRVLTTP